jgi:NTE family protein
VNVSEPPTEHPRIALALSGGGFRASVFHLGVLRAVAELGWLHRVDVMSTVSGGSVIGAFAALRWGAMLRAGGDRATLNSYVVQPFLDAITENNFIRDWAAGVPFHVFRKLFARDYTRTKLASQKFDELFFNWAIFPQLPDQPHLVMNASNLVSGRAWRFTREGMGDSRVGYARWGNSPMKVSEGVTASAAFPPVFPPVRIPRSSYQFTAPVYGEEPLPEKDFIPLTDGGVYDNLGLEVLGKNTALPSLPQGMPPAEFLIASDAGYPAQARFRSSGLPGVTEAFLLYRVDAMARDQVAALRRRMLVRDFQNAKLQGTLVTLGSGIDRAPEWAKKVDHKYLIPQDLLTQIKAIRTNFDAFSQVECDALMYHAYTMTHAFLWMYHRQNPEYSVPDPPCPEWRIEFSEERIKEWKRWLRHSDSGHFLTANRHAYSFVDRIGDARHAVLRWLKGRKT